MYKVIIDGVEYVPKNGSYTTNTIGPSTANGTGPGYCTKTRVFNVDTIYGHCVCGSKLANKVEY